MVLCYVHAVSRGSYTAGVSAKCLRHLTGVEYIMLATIFSYQILGVGEVSILT